MPEDDFVLSKRHSYVSVENLLINVLFFTIVLILFRWLIDEKVNYKSCRCIIFSWIFNISFLFTEIKI
ncbi:hypothetical protein ACR59_04115 [Staphylococcus aureus]|nr:hypothetical protein ACR58_03335 [Staphylococcus aureus]KSA67944.1 hypothetical protein ACR59_04115 [Staphylococcus aureus]